jgi:hypothetical protein
MLFRVEKPIRSGVRRRARGWGGPVALSFKKIFIICGKFRATALPSAQHHHRLCAGGELLISDTEPPFRQSGESGVAHLEIDGRQHGAGSSGVA